MRNKAISSAVWFIPLAPLAIAFAIYFGDLQSSSFLFINRLTQVLPDSVWSGLTLLGNGWVVFAIAFPLLLLSPRLLTAGIFAGAIAAITSSTLKPLFNLPRPASVLTEGTFYRLGEPLMNKSFPSGHTITAFAIASAIYFSCDKDKRVPILALFILAAFVGLSRNAVGAHWFTDVLAGAGVGMWCGLIGALLASKFPENQLGPKKIWSHLIALGGVIAIYAHLTQIGDLELNLPLQYLSITILVITLIFYTKAQFIIVSNKAE